MRCGFFLLLWVILTGRLSSRPPSRREKRRWPAGAPPRALRATTSRENASTRQDATVVRHDGHPAKHIIHWGLSFDGRAPPFDCSCLPTTPDGVQYQDVDSLHIAPSYLAGRGRRNPPRNSHVIRRGSRLSTSVTLSPLQLRLGPWRVRSEHTPLGAIVVDDQRGRTAWADISKKSNELYQMNFYRNVSIYSILDLFMLFGRRKAVVQWFLSLDRTLVMNLVQAPQLHAVPCSWRPGVRVRLGSYYKHFYTSHECLARRCKASSAACWRLQ